MVQVTYDFKQAVHRVRALLQIGIHSPQHLHSHRILWERFEAAWLKTFVQTEAVSQLLECPAWKPKAFACSQKLIPVARSKLLAPLKAFLYSGEGGQSLDRVKEELKVHSPSGQASGIGRNLEGKQTADVDAGERFNATVFGRAPRSHDGSSAPSQLRLKRCVCSSIDQLHFTLNQPRSVTTYLDPAFKTAAQEKGVGASGRGRLCTLPFAQVLGRVGAHTDLEAFSFWELPPVQGCRPIRHGRRQPHQRRHRRDPGRHRRNRRRHGREHPESG